MLLQCDLHNAGGGSHMIMLGFMAEGKMKRLVLIDREGGLTL